jgi:hypothetical protein
MFTKIFVFFTFLFFSFSSAFSRVNESVVHDALGFMLGGDSGWGAVTNEYEIDGCVTTYVQQFLDMKLIAIYDFNKALWNSAASQVGDDGVEYFILNGEVGVQEVYAYDADGMDVSDGLWVFGLEAGPSTTMFFPILVEISRFENAMYDLMDECPGIKSKY